MADVGFKVDMKIVKNSKILVNVEEALQDILVVSYNYESKVFQGVLLDSTKRSLPCGIIPPAVSPKAAEEEDKLYSLSQRFSYFQEKQNSRLNVIQVRRSIKPRVRTGKMTVRLRPRQVLCSKCRSICNENSENVGHSTHTKASPIHPPPPPRPLFSNNRADLPTSEPPMLCPSLIPKLHRMHPSEITNAINGKIDFWLTGTNKNQDAKVDDDDDDDRNEGMVLRKKKSVGSMEDLWDETVFEDPNRKARTTPVIKISFGSEGEGTVLKIPAKVQNCSESDTEDKQKTASAKAAKRALKKAKKEARRKMMANTSPRPLQRGATSPAYEALYYRRHRHKVKHKKKHKEERAEDIKERCLKQKLSISLRRLNANAYACREESGSSPASSHSSEEALPDFPPPPTVFPGKGAPPSSDSVVQTPDGKSLSVGDVVWGKIHGFPWWPGKVISISVSDAVDSWQAQVAWYGSSTSSLMPCDQLSPFLETFKLRFNKRKKSGPYKEAIRQATTDAESQPDSAVSLPALSLSALTASPTQVQVLS